MISSVRATQHNAAFSFDHLLASDKQSDGNTSRLAGGPALNTTWSAVLLGNKRRSPVGNKLVYKKAW